MSDPRHVKLAQVLVNHSLGLQSGDKVIILSQLAGAPLAREVYRAALRAGAHPVARISLDPSLAIGSLDGLTEIKLREGSEEQIRFVEFDLQEIERCNALLIIWADENTKGLSGIAPERMALAQQASGPVMGRLMERSMAGELRWCATLFPTAAHAQEAGMALPEYEEFVFGAGLLDWDDPAA